MSDRDENTPEMNMVTGSQMLAMMGLLGDEPQEPARQTPERARQVGEQLADFVRRLDRPVTYAVGDLVQARADSPFRNDGLPRVVLQVVPGGVTAPAQMAGGCSGMVHDLLVAGLHGDGVTIVSFAVPSVHYEPYTPPVAQQAAPAPTHDGGRA